MIGCMHSWKILESVTMPSAFEQMVSGQLNAMNGPQPEGLYTQKHISLVICTACGKIRRWVETNG